MKYFEYVASLKYDEDPNYVHCRKLLETGLKDSKCSLEGKLDFSGKGTVKRGSPKKANSTSPSFDLETSISDIEPVPKKRGVAKVTRKPNQAKQQKADSDSEDEVDNHEEEKSSNAKKKIKTKLPSWRDCPSVIASNVNRAGEYKIKNNDKQQKVKKQKKTF